MAKRALHLLTLIHGIVAAGAQTPTNDLALNTEQMTDEPCYSLEIGLIFDHYPGETKWEITKGRRNSIEHENAVVLMTSPYYDKKLNYAEASETHIVCLPQGKYTFTIMDRNEDGMCCKDGEGRYALSYLSTGELMASGGEYGQFESTTFQLPYQAPQLTDADGDGVEDRTKNVIPPVILSAAGLPECDNDFGLHLQTDDYGVETTWELRERSTSETQDNENPPDGKIVASGGPYTSSFIYDISYCLHPGKYTFVFYDWQCDGLTGNELVGSYTLKVNDEEVYTGGTEMNTYWEEVNLEFTKEVEINPLAAAGTTGTTAGVLDDPISNGGQVLKSGWLLIPAMVAATMAWS